MVTVGVRQGRERVVGVKVRKRRERVEDGSDDGIGAARTEECLLQSRWVIG